jgi:hypothetical protein
VPSVTVWLGQSDTLVLLLPHPCCQHEGQRASAAKQHVLLSRVHAQAAKPFLEQAKHGAVASAIIEDGIHQVGLATPVNCQRTPAVRLVCCAGCHVQVAMHVRMSQGCQPRASLSGQLVQLIRQS